MHLLTTSDLPLPRSRVALIVNMGRPLETLAWGLSTRNLRPLPELKRATVQAREVLASSGEAFIAALEAEASDQALIAVVSFESGEVLTTPVALPVQVGHKLSCALSPRLDQVVVAHSYALPRTEHEEVGYESARVDLVLATAVGPAPVTKLATFNGFLYEEADDVPVQWSPAQQQVACSVAVWRGTRTGFQPVLSIFDVVSSQVIATWDGLSLVGSASWRPDGNALLVREFPRSPVFIMDVKTGHRTLITGVSGTANVSSRGLPRPLGFADAARLLIATQRGQTMTLSALDSGSGQVEALVRFKGGVDMYPVVSSDLVSVLQKA